MTYKQMTVKASGVLADDLVWDSLDKSWRRFEWRDGPMMKLISRRAFRHRDGDMLVLRPTGDTDD